MSVPNAALGASPSVLPPLAAPVAMDVVAPEPRQRPAPVAHDSSRPRSRRVRCVVPCFNRQKDLELLLQDLAEIDRDGVDATGEPWRADLDVLVVDNASATPLSQSRVPDGLRVVFLRSESNTGGSGGFNLGLRTALDDRRSGAIPCELIWMLDSDARVERRALVALIEAFDEDPARVGVGSALRDPATGRIYEIGGKVIRAAGGFGPMHEGENERRRPPVDRPLRADYVAACSFMVRPGAVEAAGLLPDVFIKADDVEWGVRLSRATGGTIVAAPGSVAVHPCFDRFETWVRYYYARNVFVPMATVGQGRVTRFRKAMREAVRGACQSMMQRPDLARMHIEGLRDACRGKTNGKAPDDVTRFEPFTPLASLRASLEAKLGSRGLQGRTAWIHPYLNVPDAAREAIRAQLAEGGARVVEPAPRGGRAPRLRSLPGAFFRLVTRPPHEVAIVPTRGTPTSWFQGRLQAQVAPEGFVLRRPRRVAMLRDSLSTLAQGASAATRLAVRPLRVESWPGAIDRSADVATLSIVVLCHNRRDELLRTLAALHEDPSTRDAELIVVDNASNDGSAEAARRAFPGVRVVALTENIGVGGFNRGVAEATGDAVLVLDDDAVPASGAVARALAMLRESPDAWAVTLHPRHPSSGASEWPFASDEPSDDWPVMGCANLVRRWAWALAGGYEGSFFLYRNDADLAMKIRRLGGRVLFDPSLVVWHNSPIAARKSDRWLRCATRNWIWMARRHGRGMERLTGALAGWAWAHRLAGPSPARHARVLLGALAGFIRPAPPLPLTVQAAPIAPGDGIGRLLRVRLRRRAR